MCLFIMDLYNNLSVQKQNAGFYIILDKAHENILNGMASHLINLCEYTVYFK